MEAYRVFVGPLQSLPRDVGFSFYESPRKYMVVYATKAPNESFVEIPTEKEKNLSSHERTWLVECKKHIKARSLLDQFIERFQTELETARREMEKHEPRKEGTDPA